MHKTDSISSGLIFDIKRFAIHDGPGIRTTVFFKGCPLACWWCHNPESRKPEIERLTVKYHSCDHGHNDSPIQTVGRFVSVNEIIAEFVKDQVFYNQSGGGVTISGGEPLMQPVFLKDLLVECKHQKLSTAVDTAGLCERDVLKSLSNLVDLYLFDIKIMDDAIHKKNTGISNDIILSNLAWLGSAGENVNVRIPLISGVTDTGANLRAIAAFVASLKAGFSVSLLPYNLFAANKYSRFKFPDKLGSMVTQQPSEIEKMTEPFKNLGIPVSVGG